MTYYPTDTSTAMACLSCGCLLHVWGALRFIECPQCRAKFWINYYESASTPTTYGLIKDVDGKDGTSGS